LIFGVRPNSPIETTIVLASSPRDSRSSSSDAYALSYIGPSRFLYASIGLNGAEPWMSHVISLNTVSNMFTVTKRTPDSTRRRASRQLMPKRLRP